jgi:hypothetical protein
LEDCHAQKIQGLLKWTSGDDSHRQKIPQRQFALKGRQNASLPINGL